MEATENESSLRMSHLYCYNSTAHTHTNMHTSSLLMFSFCWQYIVCMHYILAYTCIYNICIYILYIDTYTNICYIVNVCVLVILYMRLGCFSVANFLMTRPRMSFVFYVVEQQATVKQTNKKSSVQT